jgi:hypothetical protein
MKYNKNKNNSNIDANQGKKYFTYAITIFAILLILSLALTPPELNNCNEKLEYCGCPLDKNKIGNKNIVLVDATDPIPPQKIKDLDLILDKFILNSTSFINWYLANKEVALTSIYIINNKDPIQMVPAGSFCQLPPDLALTFSSLNKKQRLQQSKNLKLQVESSFKQLENMTASPKSEILKTIAITTSNVSSWKDGSTFILFSDLVENSNDCGFFVNMQAIPNLKQVSSKCKSWVDIISANMSSSKTTAAVCLIPRDAKSGLIAFWEDVFYLSNKTNPIFECNPDKIQERSEKLKK